MEEILKNFDIVPLDVLMIGVCSLLFIGLWKLLDKTLFTPYMALLEAREALTTGAASTAGDLLNKTDLAISKYNELITTARVSSMKKKLDAVNAAKSEAAKIVEAADAESQELLRTARWETAQKIASLKTDAFKDADKMVDEIVRKLSAPATAAIN